MAFAMDFKPGFACGGKLSAEECEERRQACTTAALASLQDSVEYKAWQHSKGERQRTAAAGMPLTSALVLALLMLAGSAGVWHATRPEHPAVLQSPIGQATASLTGQEASAASLLAQRQVQQIMEQEAFGALAASEMELDAGAAIDDAAWWGEPGSVGLEEDKSDGAGTEGPGLEEAGLEEAAAADGQMAGTAGSEDIADIQETVEVEETADIEETAGIKDMAGIEEQPAKGTADDDDSPEQEAGVAELTAWYEGQLGKLEKELQAEKWARHEAEETADAATQASVALAEVEAALLVELQDAHNATLKAESAAAEAAAAAAARETALLAAAAEAEAARQALEEQAAVAQEAAQAALRQAEKAGLEAAAALVAAASQAGNQAALEAQVKHLEQQLQLAEAQAGAVAAMAAEQDAALKAQVAELRQQLQLAEAQAGAAAAMAAEMDASLRSKLRAAQEGEQRAQQAAAEAAKDAATATRKAVEAQLAASAATSAAAAAADVGSQPSTSAPLSEFIEQQSCSAERLWLEQPGLVAWLAAAAATALVACAVLTAMGVRRRAAAALSAAAAGFDSKQIARLQRQLDEAHDASEARVAEFKKAAAAAEAAQHLAEEKHQWEAAAVQLAHATAEVPMPCKQSNASPPQRTPLAARCSNQENANTSASGGAVAALAMSAPAVLPAGKTDTPAAWLDLLQQRFNVLGSAAARAEAAAAEAAAAEQAARREQAWGQDKVSEMMTEAELLKERLSDAKQAFAEASAAQGAARATATGLQQELDGARQALVAAEAQAMQQRQRLQAELEAVLQERDELQRQVAELRAQLASKVGEVEELGECLGGLERENSNVEAQVDQVTQALIETRAHKSQLERRVAELEQDVSGLGMLAERLEGDKAVLEEQLEEAREAQAELCLASQQYIAADSAIKSIQASEDAEIQSGNQDSLLRRAVEEKVLALDLLASAERKLVEQADSDGNTVPALPVHQLLLSGRRLSGIAGGNSSATPQSRSARMATFLGTKLGRVAKLLSGETDGGSEFASTPNSARSVAGPSSVGGNVTPPANIAAWLDRTQGLFSTVDELLGQELAGGEGTEGNQSHATGAFSLPSSARQREQAAALEAALEHSSHEVEDLLAALDATAGASAAQQAQQAFNRSSAGGLSPHRAAAASSTPITPAVQGSRLEAAEAAVAAVRQQLSDAHQRLQEARRQLGEAAGQAEALKRQHGAVGERVAEGQRSVDGAQARMEAALQAKHEAEAGLARVEAELAAAQAQLESAAGRRNAATQAEERQEAQREYERCAALRTACLSDKHSALEAKQAAVGAAKVAAEALAAAEEKVEWVVDRLCRLEDDIHAAVLRRSAAQDDLLRQQAVLGDAVAAASEALERHNAAQLCLPAENAAQNGSNGGGGSGGGLDATNERSVGCLSPLTAAQLAALASPGSARSSRGSLRGSRGGGAVAPRSLLTAAVEAERVAELLEDGWRGFSPRDASSQLDSAQYEGWEGEEGLGEN